MTTYEHANRTRKVAALLATIDELGITSNEMRGLSEDGWEQLAHDAGVILPHEETRRQVIERMAELEAEQKTEAAREDAEMCETGVDRCPTRE